MQTAAPEKLQELVDRKAAVFDVLADFFYHENELIRKAALEVPRISYPRTPDLIPSYPG